MSRFGESSSGEIEKAINNNVPRNTVNSTTSVWRQFTLFCVEKKYELVEETSTEELASILCDWAFNMKKNNGEDYKESAVKTIWNTSAKMLQEKYFKDYKRVFNPFTDIQFKRARNARDTKRKILQAIPEKRKVSSKALTKQEIFEMALSWSEEEPVGLQRKFYHIAAYELAWRGGEAANCKVFYFKIETDNSGRETGRVEYNPVFSKTAQGGNQKLADSKWLVANTEEESVCPVRLFKQIIGRRGNHITCEKFFLTTNPFWQKPNSKGWYKNSPIGTNEISKWTKSSAKNIGLDVKRVKITNHSNRAAAVTELSRSGVGEQKLVKITGHSNPSSLKPYLQLDQEHHRELIGSIRTTIQGTVTTTAQNTSMQQTINKRHESSENQVVYNNCVFNNCNFPLH